MTAREAEVVPAMDGVPVIDGQAFVASTDILSPTFVRAIAEHTHQWMQAQGLPASKERVHAACEAQFNDPYCDALVQQMDAAGIARSVLMLPDFTHALRDSRLSIAEMIARHRAIRDRHPGRFHVMFGVDPRWGRDSVDLFERSLDAHGFDGMKLYPPCGVHPADRALWPFYEICRDRGLPVSVHTCGTASVLQLDMAHPRMVEEPSRLFPGVDFIISHASNGYSDEAVMLCTSRPNVYLDVSAYAAQPMRRVNALMEYGISHKVVFATDWPSFRGQGPQAQLLRGLWKPGGPKELMRDFEWKRFMGGTMAALLGKRKPAAMAERPAAVEA